MLATESSERWPLRNKCRNPNREGCSGPGVIDHGTKQAFRIGKNQPSDPVTQDRLTAWQSLRIRYSR
jgi:hypothetical protein